MALTKVSGDFIQDGSITQGHLHASHGITTSDIGEGSNLYFTTARVNTAVGNLSTSDLSEGTNLYYTDARVASYLTTNSYATQSYVNTQVSNLVDSAPSTLDTLNELAAALGDDANFSTTVTNSIATKLPLAGGTLTGALSGTSATFSGIGQFAGAIRITETGTSQNILIGNQDSGGANKPAMINGVNGHIRIGYGNSWTGEGGTFTSQMTFNTSGAEIIGSSSSNNAFSVTRGDGGGQAFRVQNAGEVVVSNNYFYAAGSGTSMYVQNTAVFRGNIVNDGSAGVVIADDLTVNDTLFVSEYIRHSGNTNSHIRFQNNRIGIFANSGTAGYIDLHDNGNVYIGASNSTAATFTSSGVTFAGTITASGYNNSNWDTAYGWGNHASAGYLTSYTETDTLASVTGRGNTTSATITVNQVIATNNGSGTNYRVGDDAWIGDINIANTLRVSGVQNSNNGYITFGNSSNDALGRAGTGALTWAGNTIWHAGNDGTGTGLDADLLDGQHASAFASSSHTHDASHITSGNLAAARNTANLVNIGSTSDASGVYFRSVNEVISGEGWATAQYAYNQNDGFLFLNRNSSNAAFPTFHIGGWNNAGYISGYSDADGLLTLTRSDGSKSQGSTYAGTGLSNTSYYTNIIKTTAKTVFRDAQGLHEFTGNVLITGSGSANSASLQIDNPDSNAFNHSIEAFAANLTSGESNIILVGKEGSTKNSGYIGYYWTASGSNNNFVSLGHWAADHLFRIYGDQVLSTVTLRSDVDMHAPIFYDKNNTSFYAHLDNGTGNVSINAAGTIRGHWFVSSNYASDGYTIYKGYDNWNHFIAVRGYTRPGYGKAQSSTVGGHQTSFVEYAEANATTGWFFIGSGQTNYIEVAKITRDHSSFTGSARAPFFYDSDNTAYYLNAADTGMSAVVAGPIVSKGPTSGTTAANRAFQVSVLTKGALHSDAAAGGTNGSADTAPLVTFSGSNVGNVQGGIYVSQNSSTGTTLGFFTTDSYATGPQQSLTIEDNGNVYVNRGMLQASTSIRGQIFYDTNNTGYYADPAGNSNFSSLNVAGNPVVGFSGTWNGGNMPGSRWGGYSVNGGEIVFQRDNPNNGQMSVMVDGNFYAGENNGFWSLYSGNSYNTKIGWISNSSGDFAVSGGTRNLIQLNTIYDNNTTFYLDLDGVSQVYRIKDDHGNEMYTRKHSGSDFANGTLVETDITSNTQHGASFVLEATGKSYSADPPFNFMVQGYLYNYTIIAHSGIHIGKPGFTTMKVFDYNGKLAFWWPRVSYWNSFDVHVRNAGGDTHNLVTSISNSTEPSSSKKVSVTMRASSIYGYNPGTSYATNAYAQVYYDTDNTVYKLDPHSTSVVNTVHFGNNTNNGYVSGYGTYSLNISRLAQMSLDWNANYNNPSNHGIMSTDSNGNFADSVSINSYNDITLRLDSNNNNSVSYLRVKDATTTSGNDIFTVSQAAKAILGRSGMSPQLTLEYDDHSSGERWDTVIDIGRIQERRAGSSGYPTYVTNNGYGISFQSNSDGVIFGMEDYSGGNYRPIIAWGDDTSDSPMRWLYNNGEIMSLSYNGHAIASGSHRAPIFYDSANTGYYVDPASGSNLAGNVLITSGKLKVSTASLTYGTGYGFHNIENTNSNEPICVFYHSVPTTAVQFYGLNVISAAAHNNTTSRFFAGQGGSTERIKIYSNGNIQNSNNSYGQLSDINLKENIVDATPKLDELKQIRVVNFNYIGDVDEETNIPNKQIGVIAQEVEQIFPGLVYECGDTEVPTKSVKYSVFVPMMLKAIQEQQTIIDDLKSRIETLENQ